MALSERFIMNMTSDAKIRQIVTRIEDLSNTVTTNIPDMCWYDSQYDPLDEECMNLLPFTSFIITGTAGAGKSTSISAIHQQLNCLITGATVAASQNLSSMLKSYCPTIFQAFGFKSRHINMLCRQVPKTSITSIEQLQQYELAKYWSVVADIIQETTQKKKIHQYQNMSEELYELMCLSCQPELWTTNIIIIDEAGTLPSYMLTTVVFFYWFYNSWLSTPLYRQGKVPCIVCVGSPTQTSAIQSIFNHSLQRNEIQKCDNVLSVLMENQVLRRYIDIDHNWALFINNKRCLDTEFSHMLKVMEYGLPVTDEVLHYIDRFVVPYAKICDPLEYVGWTRLFVSHQEVKTFLSSLHLALTAKSHRLPHEVKLFTCPIVCEVYNQTFQKYKEKVNLTEITIMDWLKKNMFKASNYSQFVDQDMTIINTDITEECTRITYQAKYVKNSFISLNGKTKRCICGYSGTYASFKQVLDSDCFLEAHTRDNIKYVYNFLSTLIFNSLYQFYAHGIQSGNKKYLVDIQEQTIPPILLSDEEAVEALTEDTFYLLATPPPQPSQSTITEIINWYSAVKQVYLDRLQVATNHFGEEFLSQPFSTYTTNIHIRDDVEFTSTETVITGLLDYASTVESYQLKGYTFVSVGFGKQFSQRSDYMSKTMPMIIVQDSMGFISCLNTNFNKITEILEDGSSMVLGCTGDYGISSKLAMTIVKAQGMSLSKVAVAFGKYKTLQHSHAYVAISRATNPKYLVIDRNPMRSSELTMDTKSAGYIIKALHNPKTLLVY
ncbi:helicase-primase helicase subunit [Wood mouse herpesvirus]|uniref:Helicase-primase helicase subunit n=1 Tax=Wood mouse herpesvirus TaxID=432370 RepID=D0PPD2_9GAMA|nr:helicase-primase helicase subunit [Wood mouse herpesvirus]ABO48423.1 helicase-primase helicase subunit [Wood mouse herpesvirus]ACY41115.1 helicase-primase helicase subunit [Wood mouse herpesvirus]